jgi:hypothetical protein
MTATMTEACMEFLPDLMGAGGIVTVDDELPAPVLLAQGRRADLVWTRSEYMRLLRHLHNGNPETHFYHGWWTTRDHETKEEIPRTWKAIWSKRAMMNRKAEEAWDTICGRRDGQEVTIGFPAMNKDTKESFWGGMDWDGRTPEAAAQAREWAFRAFALCRKYEDFFLILETSGSGGWHLYILMQRARPVDEWARMLRQIAELIGAKVEKGICEIFPPDNAAKNKFGTILRAPGTFNGKTGRLSEIVYEDTKPLLEKLPPVAERGNWRHEALNAPHYKEEPLCSGFLLRNTEDKLTAQEALLVAKNLNLNLGGYEIAAKRRYAPLQRLVGDTFPKMGRTLAKALAEHFFIKSGGTHDCRDWGDHYAEFLRCWEWMNERQFLPSLTDKERAIHKSATEESQREAFKIVRNFAWADARKNDGKGAFPVSVANLGMRLILGRKATGKIRKWLVESGAIEEVAPAVPTVRPASFRWVACDRGVLAGVCELTGDGLAANSDDPF